jgi:hypothetical protein
VLFIVFGGLYVNAENVPRALRWIPRASLIKHAYQAMIVNEFGDSDAKFEADAAGGGMRDGAAVLRWLGFDGPDGGIRPCVAQQARLLACFYYATFLILKARKPAYAACAPSTAEGDAAAAAAAAEALAAAAAAAAADEAADEEGGVAAA